MQNAADSSYRDPTNLQGKLQKHQAFEAEVSANEDRIASVIKTGQGLANENNDQMDLVLARIKRVEDGWRALCNQSQDKGQKLKEANNQQQYNYNVEDVEFWLSEVELLLESKDLGKALASVNTLIKKHQLLETDIASHADRIEAVNKQASDFVKAGHFDADNIQAKQHIINDRYDALRQSASARGLQLAESQKAHRIFRDVDDEESWIKEKSRIAASTD